MAQCDYCNTPGKVFTAVIEDCRLKNICYPCIAEGKKPPKPKGLPCFDYTPNDDEGIES